MKVSLWLGASGQLTLRFDVLDIGAVAALMRAVRYRQKVQICDQRRNILGTWQCGELRDAAGELSRIMRGARDLICPDGAPPAPSSAATRKTGWFV